MGVSTLPPDAATLLIVDDEPLITNLFCETMERGGFRALAASSGNQALAYFEGNTSPIQLAVVDMTMPGMSGLEVAEAMARIVPDIPVIIATGLSADEVQGMPPNVVEVIQKPYRNKDLIIRIREILSGKG